MCLRWPAKNHKNDPFGGVRAVTDGRIVDSGTTYVRMAPESDSRGAVVLMLVPLCWSFVRLVAATHQKFNQNPIGEMSFTNCPYGDFIIPGPSSGSDSKVL